MNIFESLYKCCNENTKAPFESYKVFTDKVETYCKQAKRNPKEEFLTQIFTYIMLKDVSFRKAFLEKLEIADGEWNFQAEYSYSVKSNEEKKSPKGEMDVFGNLEAIKSLLIIENKLDSEIGLEQPKKYAGVFTPQQDKKDGEKDYSEYSKYIVVLTKFSGLITYWNSYEGGIKEKIVSALQNEIDNKFGKGKYICKHIYWHEVYELLKNNFTDTEMQQELLAFLKNQNLDQEWCQDMGCPYWRQEFIKEFNKFADLNGLEKKSVPDPFKKGKGDKPNISAIGLHGEENYFGGARIQGARAAEKSGNCSLLQINVNGKVKDLSDYINDPAECIKHSAEMILEAYGKK